MSMSAPITDKELLAAALEDVKQLRAQLEAEQAKSEKLAGQVAFLSSIVDEEVDEAERYVLRPEDALKNIKCAFSAAQSDVEAYLADIKNQGAIEALKDAAFSLHLAGYVFKEDLERMAAERKKKG